jgi:hypothetical protein
LETRVLPTELLALKQKPLAKPPKFDDLARALSIRMAVPPCFVGSLPNFVKLRWAKKNPAKPGVSEQTSFMTFSTFWRQMLLTFYPS